VIDNHLQTDLSTHRDMLFRWFIKQVGDVQTSEDLTQETLVEAWNNRHKLVDPAGLTSWLYAIASNIHKRWLRQSGRDRARYAPLSEETFAASAPNNIELSRADLITLLDRALAELPAETRRIVLMRYLEDLPQVKVAQILGLSESAVAVRLHRGKLELRRHLQAETNGETSSSWQRTNIWCPVCGLHFYEGKLDSQTGELVLWCPRCFPDARFPDWGHTETADLPLIKGLTSFKPALNRVMKIWRIT
jgi:RNA polymerase sigma factor (sigma-70 family)